MIQDTLRYSSPVSHVWVCHRSVYTILNGYRDLPGAEDYDFLLRLVTAGMKCTNLKNYYGYFVRLGRHGNTVSVNGIEQKKLHEYIYKMYQRRVSKKEEGYIPCYKPKYMKISKTLYCFSNLKFHSAKINYFKKNYVASFADFVMTLLSPHMLHIYYLRLIYKIKTRHD